MTITPEILGDCRNTQAIICEDDKGTHEFLGRTRVNDACTYRPVGEPRWFKRQLNGELRPVTPPELPAPPSSQTVHVLPPAPSLDAVRLALEYGERQADRYAKVYADAYKVAGTSWAAVVQPLAQALQALSSRVVTLEERLEELPEPAPAQLQEPSKPSPLDDLAEGVLAGVVHGAMNAKS